jgi:hypothetical protein
VAGAAAGDAVFELGGEVVAVQSGVDQIDRDVIAGSAVDAAVAVAFEHCRPQLPAPVAAVFALAALLCVPVGVAVAAVVSAAATLCDLAAAGFGQMLKIGLAPGGGLRGRERRGPSGRDDCSREGRIQQYGNRRCRAVSRCSKRARPRGSTRNCWALMP